MKTVFLVCEDKPDAVFAALLAERVRKEGSSDCNFQRKVQCLKASDLALLKSRGAKVFLAAYLDELEKRFLPFVTED